MCKDICKNCNVLNIGNKNLFKFRANDCDLIRIDNNVRNMRNNYFSDADRILYSFSYARYIDKTQVFSLTNNDHISKRILHVQMVSRVARTIGRALGLNEDLIEAASLGHDLGHPPFGHVGEKILNEISLKYNKTYFNHNVQSVRVLMNLENNGKGSNISIQVLDAILCHNGEVELSKYIYNEKKTLHDFLDDYEKCYTLKDYSLKLVPMTLEAQVVRVSDIIAYIGRDLEDAIMLEIINRNDIPKEVKEVLGDTNSEIINTIVIDIINNSYGKPYIAMSNVVYQTVVLLKEFNYQRIYNLANTVEQISLYRKMYNKLFDIYVMQLTNNDIKSKIYNNYYMAMCNEYKKNNSIYQIVIDYISGMTDDYFVEQYEQYKNGFF